MGLKGGSDDPSPVTAYGVTRAMEAAARHLFGRAELKGVRVTVLGVGHVGMPLVKELHQRGAKIWVSADELHRMEADFYAPCALGGAINDTTLPMLKVKAVVGAANNQLLTPRHGELLAERGILYVPDYAANAGGLINVAQEVVGYNREKAYARAEKIFDTIERVLTRAKASGERPEQVADRIVEERISAQPAAAPSSRRTLGAALKCEEPRGCGQGAAPGV